MANQPDMTSMRHLSASGHEGGSATSPGPSNSSNSPTEQGSVNSIRYGSSSLATPGSASSQRMGAGSPSYDGGGSRFFSKRAREIQAEEGVTPLWASPLGSPGSLRDANKPQSAASPNFPDSSPLPAFSSPSYRRARAGTVPSRFSPGGIENLSAPVSMAASAMSTQSRPTPSASPFKPQSPVNPEPEAPPGLASASAASVASRLRSGSLNLPSRVNYVGNNGIAPAANNPFGGGLFTSNWVPNSLRQSIINSASSTNMPTSPAQSSFSRDGLQEHDNASLRTLDYLGLADTSSPTSRNPTRTLDQALDARQSAVMQPFIIEALAQANANAKAASRFRSYSVNAKEQYAEDEEDDQMGQGRYGPVTPNSGLHMQAQQAINAAYGLPSITRPRARTTGILDSPPQRAMKAYLATPSRLNENVSAEQLAQLSEAPENYFNLGGMDLSLAMGLRQGLPIKTPGGTLLEAPGIEGPTRALWLGNIPASTTTSSLQAIFQAYGKIESARVLTHKNCGFVNFEKTESAMTARAMLDGKEIFPGAGPVRIGYAKEPTTPSAGTPSGGVYSTPTPDPFNKAAELTANGVNGIEARNNAAAAALEMQPLASLKADILEIVKEFGAADEVIAGLAQNIDNAVEFDDYQPEIPSVAEPSHNRVHDAPKLREIRKRIDNNNCPNEEIEGIALGMLDEIAELSSDYLGNTVVQKLFEYCSEEVKEQMLEHIAPHLAEIGIHKNGTWAGQKIIDVAKTDRQLGLICENLRPYTICLFLDQFGNYVLQCCLRFGAPWNDFIFETMLGKMWDIGQGRFGSRAMRACLESHHANKDQQRLLAAAIALHSVQLATNANGALLLTWFLDTCTFPRRRTVLAPRLVPHLVHLCTHKVAYLTVLKVINQRNEPEARDVILKALFFSPGDQTLEDILSDHSCGATLIFKVLTTPFFDENLRTEVVQNVKNVLQRIKAHPQQGYKRLMDEVGLSTKNNMSGGDGSRHRDSSREPANGSPGSGERGRSANGHGGVNHHRPNSRSQPPRGDQYNAQYYNQMATNQPFDPQLGMSVQAAAAAQMAQQQQAAILPRTGTLDQNTLQAIENLNLGNNNLFGSVGASQYGNLFAQGLANQNFYPGQNYGVGGYDQFRGGLGGLPAQQASPIPLSAQLAQTSQLNGMGINQSFSPMMNPQLMYSPYSQMNAMPMYAQQQQQHMGGGRQRGGRR